VVSDLAADLAESATSRQRAALHHPFTWEKHMTHPRTRFALALGLAGVIAGCGASVPSSADDGDPASARPSAITMLQGILDVTDSTTGPAEVGQAQTYTTVITNPTAETFTNVFGNVNAEAPVMPTMSSAKASAGHCLRNGAQNFICFFGTMAPGATFTVTSVVVPAAEGTLTFVANALTSPNDATSDEIDIAIGPAPTDVQTTGAASTGSPARGAPFTYTFAVKNNGPALADAVTFTDTLPAELPVTGVTAPAAAACSVSGQTVSCALGDVAVGVQESIVIATVAPANPATITNTGAAATASPDRNPANDAVTITVQIK
jgi:uncharacterized repeat protein (TIGR01451 family)